MAGGNCNESGNALLLPLVGGIVPVPKSSSEAELTWHLLLVKDCKTVIAVVAGRAAGGAAAAAAAGGLGGRTFADMAGVSGETATKLPPVRKLALARSGISPSDDAASDVRTPLPVAAINRDETIRLLLIPIAADCDDNACGGDGGAARAKDADDTATSCEDSSSLGDVGGFSDSKNGVRLTFAVATAASA